MKTGIRVVVTTDKDRRGVFFGTLAKGSVESKLATLKDARMAVYWTTSTKGVLGLASTGPMAGSRISPPIPSIDLNGVSSIMECSQSSVKEWESGKWE